MTQSRKPYVLESEVSSTCKYADLGLLYVSTLLIEVHGTQLNRKLNGRKCNPTSDGVAVLEIKMQ